MCKPTIKSTNNTTSVAAVTMTNHNNNFIPTTKLITTKVTTIMDDDSKVVGDGIQRRKVHIEVGLLLLSIVYGTIYWYNPSIAVFDQYCPPSSSRNKEDEPCYRPDLLAYKVTSLLAMMSMGCLGIYQWYGNATLKQISPTMNSSTPEERLFGYLPIAEYQSVIILCYQVWDFIVSLTIPEHTDPIFLTHHALAGFIAYKSLQQQVFGYYSIYYGGCSEFSSIFLVVTDWDDIFPLTIQSYYSNMSSSTVELYHTVLFAGKVLFAITFTYYRVIGWMYHSIPLWNDTLHVMYQSQTANKLRPNQSWLLYTFLSMSIVLGALQLYWFGQIVDAILNL